MRSKSVMYHIRKQMPKLSKSDQQAKISATEAERRRKVAMAQIREMERDAREDVRASYAEGYWKGREDSGEGW